MSGVLYQYVRMPTGKNSFLYISKGIETLYGITPDQALQNADLLFDVIHPDDVARVRDTTVDSYTRIEPWECEYRVILNGKIKWVLGHSIPELQADGNVLWNGLLTDNTVRKNFEERLAQTQTQLEAAQRVARV